MDASIVARFNMTRVFNNLNYNKRVSKYQGRFISYTT